MTNIRSRYIRRRPKGITFTRGVCGIAGCEETRLGTTGLCLRTHHSQFLKTVRAESEIDRDNLSCRCELPRPSNDGPMLRMFGTIQCGRCGRAIFDDDGKQLHTAADVVLHVNLRNAIRARSFQ